MSFVPTDWSNFSYKEVKNMLEEYRSNYILKEEDVKLHTVNSDADTE